MLKLMFGIVVSIFVVSLVSAETKVDFSLKTPPSNNPGNSITISPDRISSGSNQGTSNPPQNPSQASPAPSPGIVVTIPIGSGNK